MKNKIVLLIFLVFATSNTFAQNKYGIIGEENWFFNWTCFKPKLIEYKATTKILVGDIKENTTLSRRDTYLLMGTVHVANNATLTIEPGTVIRGDFDTNGTLIVTKGAKIIAEGTDTNPIVFTSNKSSSDRKPGDWGGIILMGDAPLNRFGGFVSSFYDKNPLYNTFGGTNEDCDLGVLKYVRIEFAGKKNDDKIALNGLTLAAVGSKTKIDFVQISFAADDSYEAIGGNVDLNNVISFRAFDDDFDYSMGTQSNINNAVAIRSPFMSDTARSRCLEMDSYDKLENYDPTKKKTVVKLNNVTFVNNEENSASGLVKEAISLKYDSFLEVNNSIVVGFSSFIALDNKYLENQNFKSIKVKNTTIDSCTELFTNEILYKAEVVNSWFENYLNVSAIGIVDLFKNNNIKSNPDFRIKS